MRQQDTEGTKRIPEPDPGSDMSAGAWEDALRKWKLQVSQLVKQYDDKGIIIDYVLRINGVFYFLETG